MYTPECLCVRMLNVSAHIVHNKPENSTICIKIFAEHAIFSVLLISTIRRNSAFQYTIAFS